MLTKDDLGQIGELLKAEREETRKIVKEEAGVVEKRLNLRMDIMEKKIDSSKQEVLVVVGREAEDLGGMFQETWKFIDKQTAELKAEIHSVRLKQIEERLSKLEKLQAHNHS